MTTIYDVGDVAVLTATVRTEAGTLANAGTMTCTVTPPSGPAQTPAVSNPSTGNYRVEFLSTLPGLHLARWVATGANAGAFTDQFTVITGVPLLTAAQVCARQRVALPIEGSTEAAALDLAVANTSGLVLAFLRRETVDGMTPAGAEAVRAVAVRVAGRAWRNPNDAASESYGGEQSHSWSDPRILTGDEKAALRPWRRRVRGPIFLTPR